MLKAQCESVDEQSQQVVPFFYANAANAQLRQLWHVMALLILPSKLVVLCGDTVRKCPKASKEHLCRANGSSFEEIPHLVETGRGNPGMARTCPFLMEV